MADEMINKTKPTPKRGVQGIGDTAHIHYNEWDMNQMNNPIADAVNNENYTKGQSTKGSK